jgi:hypothetical protein
MRRLWIIVLTLILIGGVVGSLTVIKGKDGDPVICLSCWIGGHHHHASEAGMPALRLKTLALAQEDFRTNDRDRDRVNQFWRADVAGLYALAPGGGPAIKLIELQVAAADDRPLAHLQRFAVQEACSGYWYRAIRHADEDPKTPDLHRFAYCVFPDSASAGKYIYVLDERNTVYYRSVADGRRGIEVFPTDEELRTSWAKHY